LSLEPFADLLKFPGEHPVHVERFSEVVGDFAVAAAAAHPVHLLQCVHIRIKGRKDVEHVVELRAARDVPRHDADFLRR